VAAEDSFDEFSAHFSGQPPRTIVTTSPSPSEQLLSFIEEVLVILPNSEYRKRGAVPIKQIVEASAARGFTNLLVFTEKAKVAKSVWLTKLPGGPTAHFKLSSVVRAAASHSAQLRTRASRAAAGTGAAEAD